MENKNIVVICGGYYDSSEKIIPCGKINIDKTIWKSEDELKLQYPEVYSNYLTAKKNETLSHGICPDCYKESMRILDLDDLKDNKNSLKNKTNTGCWPLEADPRIFM